MTHELSLTLVDSYSPEHDVKKKKKLNKRYAKQKPKTKEKGLQISERSVLLWPTATLYHLSYPTPC